MCMYRSPLHSRLYYLSYNDENSFEKTFCPSYISIGHLIGESWWRRLTSGCEERYHGDCRSHRRQQGRWVLRCTFCFLFFLECLFVMLKSITAHCWVQQSTLRRITQGVCNFSDRNILEASGSHRLIVSVITASFALYLLLENKVIANISI